MGFRPGRLFFVMVRVMLGLLLISWGLIGVIIPILPGGFWTIFLGLAVLAIDIPFVKTLDYCLKVWVEKRFPRFYARIFMPVHLFKEKFVEKIRSIFGGGEEGQG